MKTLFMIFDFDRMEFYCEACEAWVGAMEAAMKHINKHKEGKLDGKSKL